MSQKMDDQTLLYEWRPLLSDSDLDSLEPVVKKYKCKYADCARSFCHSQNRSRHYRQNHSSKKESKCSIVSIPAVVNIISDGSGASLDPVSFIGDKGVRDAFSLTESFFHCSDADVAADMIKSSMLVQENAAKMRLQVESVINSTQIEADRSKQSIISALEGLFYQMNQKHCVKQYEDLSNIIELALKAEKSTIGYLKTFSHILSMTIDHAESFNESVNVKLKQARLLTRVLSSMVPDVRPVESSPRSDYPKHSLGGEIFQDKKDWTSLESGNDVYERPAGKKACHQKFNSSAESSIVGKVGLGQVQGGLTQANSTVGVQISPIRTSTPQIDGSASSMFDADAAIIIVPNSAGG